MRNYSPYELDGKPRLLDAIPLGLQHVLAMFVSNITPVIIVLGVLNVPLETKTSLIQACMFVAGINTLIQNYTLGPFGSKLPVVMGSNFAFVPVCISVGIKYGIEGILGAVLIGGLFEIIVGIFIKRIRKYFPPIVTGVVVLSIGLSLIPIGINSFAGGFGASDFGSYSNLFVGGLVLTLVIVFKQFGKGMWSTASIFIATIIGYAVALFLGKVDLSGVAQASLLNIPKPFVYGMSFHIDAILAMIVMFIVSAVETMGDMSGITMGGADRELTDKELSGGIMGDGLGCVIASCFSVLPTTSFSQNVGIIAMTKIMSRFVVVVGSLILMCGAFFPKLGVILVAIPQSVIGGSLVMIFAMIFISGVELITKEPLGNKNSTILAASLGVGFGLGAVPEAIQYLPEGIKLLFGGSGIAVSAAVAVVLNIVLPNDKPQTSKVRDAKEFEPKEKQKKHLESVVVNSQIK